MEKLETWSWVLFQRYYSPSFFPQRVYCRYIHLSFSRKAAQEVLDTPGRILSLNSSDVFPLLNNMVFQIKSGENIGCHCQLFLGFLIDRAGTAISSTNANLPWNKMPLLPEITGFQIDDEGLRNCLNGYLLLRRREAMALLMCIWILIFDCSKRIAFGVWRRASLL